MTTVELLRKARAEIVRRGWCQGSAAIDGMDGPVCALGAIGAAAEGNPFRWPLYLTPVNALERAGTSIVGGWNDAPGRTVDEVLALYDRAIAAEDAKLTP